RHHLEAQALARVDDLAPLEHGLGVEGDREADAGLLRHVEAAPDADALAVLAPGEVRAVEHVARQRVGNHRRAAGVVGLLVRLDRIPVLRVDGDDDGEALPVRELERLSGRERGPGVGHQAIPKELLELRIRVALGAGKCPVKSRAGVSAMRSHSARLLFAERAGSEQKREESAGSASCTGVCSTSPEKMPCAPRFSTCNRQVPGVWPGAASRCSPRSISWSLATRSALRASITGSTLSAKEPWLGNGSPRAIAARCSRS